MNTLTVLQYALAIIETGALIGALFFSAKGMKERNNKDTRKSLLVRAAIYFVVFLALSAIRNTYFQV